MAYCNKEQEAQLSQRNRATLYVSKFMLCFKEIWQFRKVSISNSDLQGHSRALALVPFDSSHIDFLLVMPIRR